MESIGGTGQDGVDDSFGADPEGRTFLGGLLPMEWSRLPADVLAGVTLAALAIPEVMGYTRIAGTPVVTGLYTLLLPAVLFALLGSSRHLVVGADSATAAIMAAALAPLAQPASREWMQLACVLALACAALLMLARLARLAFLADFLSRTVLAGFLTGVGLQVALGELPVVLGIAAGGAGTLAKMASLYRNLERMNGADALVGTGVLAFVLLFRRLAPRLPVALLAVAGVIAGSWAFDLQSRGVTLVGALAGGLPPFSLPDFALALQHLPQLGPAAFAMSVVILAQSAATSRAYAWKYGERFSENADLLGLAAANAAAALTGAFVVNGSPTKTQMVDAAGGRSQWAHLGMAAVVVGVLLFLTAPIAFLPKAALSAIVFVIGIDLLHVRDLKTIYLERRSEFWVALATAAAVVLTGVELAIILAMLLSLVDHVRRGYRPHNSVIIRGEDGHGRLAPAQDAGQYQPGLLIYRFGHSMYYANAEVLSREVSALAQSAVPVLQWLAIDMDAVDDVDFSAGAALNTLQQMLAKQGTALKYLRVSAPLVAQLQAYGLVTEGHLEGVVFASLRELRHAFERQQKGD